jgi:hypothetical protein
MVFGLLMHPQRMSRLVEYHARNKNNPGIKEVLLVFEENIFDGKTENSYQEAIQLTTQSTYVNQLMKSIQMKSLSPLARAEMMSALEGISIKLSKSNYRSSDLQKAHNNLIVKQIKLFMESPMEFKAESAPDLPPGSPIGSCDF